jgi:hypothetical protein
LGDVRPYDPGDKTVIECETVKGHFIMVHITLN